MSAVSEEDKIKTLTLSGIVLRESDKSECSMRTLSLYLRSVSSQNHLSSFLEYRMSEANIEIFSFP